MDLPNDLHYKIGQWIGNSHATIIEAMSTHPTRAFRLYLNYANACAEIFYLVEKEKYADVEEAMSNSNRAFRSYLPQWYVLLTTATYFASPQTVSFFYHLPKKLQTFDTTFRPSPCPDKTSRIRVFQYITLTSFVP